MASTMKEPSPLTFTYSDQDGEPDHSPGLHTWIQTLQTSTDQQFIINLERISTAKRAYSHWEEIADALATYLLNPNLQHVLVPSSLVDMISGKCGKVLRTKLLPLLPPSVQFKDLTIDLKSLLSVSCYTNKIKCSNPDNQGQEKNVTEFLNELANDSDRVIPVSLTRAIVRASKFICKWRRSKYTAKSRLNEMNENSQQAPNINPQNPKSGINNDPSKIDTSKIDASKIDTDPIPPVNKSTKCCYVCKTRYLRRGYRGSGAAPPVPPSASAPIRQYPRLCPPCADTNWTKRRARVDLTGRYAVVTGGRIKIGFQVVLKLLRDGCHVIATTRFPRNAARDYAQQHDFATWKHRLKLYPLDLKDIAGIYSFVSYVKSTFPHLDILINNAAQTLRRPMDFYRDLLDLEHIPHSHVPALQQAVLASTASLDYGLTGGGAGGGGGGGQAVSRGQSTAMIAVTAPKAIVAAPPNQTCRIEEVSEEEDVDNGETVAKVPKLENVGPDLEADQMKLDAQSTPPSTSFTSSKQEDNISMDTDLVSSSKTPDQMKLDAQSTPPSTSFTVSKQEDNISMDTEPSSKTQDNVFGRQNSEPCVSSVPKYDIMGSGSGRKRALYARQRSSPLNLIKTQTSTTAIRAPSYSSPSSSSSSSIRASSSLSSTSISTPTVLRSSHSSSSSSSISASSFASPFSMARYFPCGLRDADGQQLDLRRTNTWRAVLGTVSLGELMEVLVVNTVAPFILAKELKGHLSKDREGETEGERGGGKRKREREGERMRETSRWEGERGGGKGERGGGKRKMCWGKMKRERIWETGRGKGERGGGKRKTSSTSSSPSSSTPSSTSSKPTSTPTSTPTQATSTSHTSPSSSTSFSTSTSTSSKPTSTPTSTSTTSSSTSTQTTSAPSSTSSTPTQPTSTPTTSKPTTPPSSASSAPPPPAPHPEALHRRFVVNVSAMEGQFSRRGKNRFHPHTNMAKAALNMMTRTAALEYADHAIYMSAVDTGWVSDERPFHLAQREARRGFRLPLDCVDGAARVLDPIISGLTSTQTPHHAVFLKNYNVYPW